jgi:hypothetical protein
MNFACPTCLGIPTETDQISLLDLDAMRQDCETCSLLWSCITAIVGPHVGEYFDHVVIHGKAVGDAGPLRLDVCDYQGRTEFRMQLYRAEGTL